MHILVLPSWYPNNSEDINGVFFRDQAKALVEAGHKVGVIAVNLRSLRYLIAKNSVETPPLFEIVEGIHTYRDSVWKLLSRMPYSKYLLWRRGANRLLARYIAEHGMPDIIHAHSTLFAGKVAAEWRKRYGVPVVVTEHKSGFARGKIKPWQLGLARKAALGADALIAVSPPLGDVLSRELAMASDAWRWIPNMVASRFSDAPAASEEQSRQPNQPPRLINLAMMTENKGQFDLLAAFAKAFPAPSGVELWFGGDGPIRPQLEEQAQALNIAGRVRFLGRVPPEDVPALLVGADMMVLPSHYETFGVVVAEALSLGVPVIATRCGGPECIIQQGDGVLVEPHAPDELAEVLKEQVKKLSDYDRSAIRARALGRFSGPAVTAQLGALYEEVLAAGGAQ
jgi:glycosyltransferase involved in cell wall biosynthesis